MSHDAISPEQFGGYRNVEHVPIEHLERIREWNRETTPKWGPHDTTLHELTEDIRQHGVKSPVIITYGKRDRRALLGEGNTRLAAARRLGMTHLPARVNRVSTLPEGHPVPGHDPGLESHGYIPADLKPSQIGMPIHEPK